jgi:hypothetical protein
MSSACGEEFNVSISFEVIYSEINIRYKMQKTEQMPNRFSRSPSFRSSLHFEYVFSACAEKVDMYTFQ